MSRQIDEAGVALHRLLHRPDRRVSNPDEQSDQDVYLRALHAPALDVLGLGQYVRRVVTALLVVEDARG